METQAARGIVIKDNKVLLIFRKHNDSEYYSVPGGIIEEGETKEKAVIREILEETNLNVRIDKYLGEFINDKGSKLQHLFLCVYIEGTLTFKNAPENKDMENNPKEYYEPMWVELVAVKDMVIQPKAMATFVKELCQSTNKSYH